MKLKLCKYPHPALDTICVPVTEFDHKLTDYVAQMTKIMQKFKGIGLAANQVGLNIQLLIVQTHKGPIEAVINPKILDLDNEELMTEGCLSAPGILLPIKRPANIYFMYQNLEGTWKKAVAYGRDARVLLHEYDHLQGQFFLDLVDPELKARAISILQK